MKDNHFSIHIFALAQLHSYHINRIPNPSGPTSSSLYIFGFSHLCSHLLIMFSFHYKQQCFKQFVRSTVLLDTQHRRTRARSFLKGLGKSQRSQTNFRAASGLASPAHVPKLNVLFSGDIGRIRAIIATPFAPIPPALVEMLVPTDRDRQ